MSAMTRRDQRTSLFPDLMDMLESPFLAWRPGEGSGRTHTPRAEDYVENGNYVVRMELPDIDPEKDVDITVSGDMLQVSAHREVEHKDGKRTEFRYGAFTRTIPLPRGVSASAVRATYDKGILTVSVPLPDADETARRIPIQTGATSARDAGGARDVSGARDAGGARDTGGSRGAAGGTGAPSPRDLAGRMGPAGDRDVNGDRDAGGPAR